MMKKQQKRREIANTRKEKRCITIDPKDIKMSTINKAMPLNLTT